jgi:hypothetical protein
MSSSCVAKYRATGARLRDDASENFIDVRRAVHYLLLSPGGEWSFV